MHFNNSAQSNHFGILCVYFNTSVEGYVKAEKMCANPWNFRIREKNQLKSREFQDPVRVPKNEKLNLRKCKARNTKNRSKTAALC